MTHWDLEAAGRAANALSMNAYRTVAGVLEIRPQGWKGPFVIDPASPYVKQTILLTAYQADEFLRFKEKYQHELNSKPVETT